MTPPVDNAGALRRPLAPRTPRRVSGPARPARSGAPANKRAQAAGPGRLRRFAAALPDARSLDRLVRGRAWIAIVACALVGIVYLQVSLLGMNAGITRSLAVAQHLETENAQLQSDIARAGAGGRVQDAAARAGMVLPPAAWADYLTVGRRDAARAAVSISPPDPAAELRNAAANAALAPVDALPTIAPQASQTAATAPAIAPSADGTQPTAETAAATTAPAAESTQSVTPVAATPTVAATATPAPTVAATPTPTPDPTPAPAVSSTSVPAVSSGTAAATSTSTSPPTGGISTGGASPSVAAGPG